MLQEIFLASYSYFEGEGVGNFLNEMEDTGFFSYILPFLLIFALVFGILSQIRIFEKRKSVNGVIAFVVGLMALQFDLVPTFFSEIFPRLGIGLAIMLVLLILAGMFVDPRKGGIIYTLMGVGVVITIIVLVQTAGSLGWSSSYWWYDHWKTAATMVVILLVLAVVVGSTTKDSDNDRNSLRPLGWFKPEGS